MVWSWEVGPNIMAAHVLEVCIPFSRLGLHGAISVQRYLPAVSQSPSSTPLTGGGSRAALRCGAARKEEVVPFRMR